MARIAAGKDLPQMLQCAWVGSRPVLTLVPFSPGDGIPHQAAANAAKDPERDLLGSVVLTPEQALQEVPSNARFTIHLFLFCNARHCPLIILKHCMCTISFS